MFSKKKHEPKEKEKIIFKVKNGRVKLTLCKLTCMGVSIYWVKEFEPERDYHNKEITVYLTLEQIAPFLDVMPPGYGMSADLAKTFFEVEERNKNAEKEREDACKLEDLRCSLIKAFYDE